MEEAELEAPLQIAGTVFVDSGDAGIGVCLYVFVGRCDARYGERQGVVHETREGTALWIPVSNLKNEPIVPDVAVMLERITSAQPNEIFSGRSFYVEDKLTLVFE